LQSPTKHDFHKTQSASSLLCYEAGADRFDWCSGVNTGRQIMSFRRQILYRGHGCQFSLKFIRRNTNISSNTLTWGVNHTGFDKISL
jgi:hypothetical protein